LQKAGFLALRHSLFAGGFSEYDILESTKVEGNAVVADAGLVLKKVTELAKIAAIWLAFIMLRSEKSLISINYSFARDGMLFATC